MTQGRGAETTSARDEVLEEIEATPLGSNELNPGVEGNFVLLVDVANHLGVS